MGVGQNGHKSVEQIQQEIAEASEKVKVGGIYTHYKGADKRYKVLHFSSLEATDELCVVYQALYVPGDLSFVRPVSVWLETVEWEGKTVPRFKPEA
jgi:hypothetical protein